ncbi:hypothetical protein JY97_12735 [Alkalispirochaeta odontotermitis]|nr:hypothetical protein JY97_12735 [Alkalispirochaeta odontotermitis]CAB1068299.1 hypothetical protein D1AOALGA4SA_314 [Olavius algarvensis Delta 1 endosymbiont]
MLTKKIGLVLTLIAVLTIGSLPLEPMAQAAGRDREFRERHKPLDRKKIFEEFRANNPEIMQMMHNLREMQNEARRLAREYRKQNSPEQKREIEDRIRFLVEDILRQQHAITERTLEYLAERYEQLRERHQHNLERFDDIAEQRYRALLRIQ